MFFLKLLNVLERESFDVVHLQAERSFFWYALTARITRSRRILRTVQNSFNFSGYLRMKRAVQRWIASRILGVLFVSVSNSVAETEMNRFHNRTLTIPNWTDHEKFFPPNDPEEKMAARQKLGIPADKVVLVSVGACIGQKNHSHILTAIHNISKQHGNIFYLHLGDGPLAHEELSYATDLGIAQSVKFAGQLEDVRSALIASDVFVMPSKYEGMPVAALEAMSCGLPAVVYKVSGLKDAVQNEMSGIVVEPDPKALSRAISRLVSDSNLRKRMGEAALKVVNEDFNMKKSVRKYISIYRSKKIRYCL
jgi:glycosyltransferase involved in cell wall biosynthesis